MASKKAKRKEALLEERRQKCAPKNTVAKELDVPAIIEKHCKNYGRIQVTRLGQKVAFSFPQIVNGNKLSEPRNLKQLFTEVAQSLHIPEPKIEPHLISDPKGEVSGQIVAILVDEDTYNALEAH